MIVGIDLGTTFSAVAALDERGRPTTVPNRDGELLTPSAVLIADGEAVVGQPALDVALEQPDQVATIIKRRMGQPDYGRPIAGRQFRPETLSAIILRKLVQDAETRLGPIRRAVITVPAYFDDTRRKATQDAGRIAGLEVLDILDEPSAAALAFSLQGPDAAPGPTKTVLVYDLGGGTFDVTLVRLARRHFQTLAIEGDVQLGGKDWDDRIVAYVADQFRERYGDDPRSDRQSLVLLQAAAERAKRTLSRLPQTTITCTHAGWVLSVPLSREQFEGLTRDLLTRTRLTVQQLLRQANVGWEQVHRILLVGGSTHMPMTAAMLRDLSGKEPDHSLAVSEVVARGAALHAGIILTRTGDESESTEELADIVEVNVTAHSLGVEVRHDGRKINDVLIAKNTQIPAAGARVYSTVRHNQRRVRVGILQGEAHQAEACIRIGECWIDDLPPGLPARSPVEVRCGCAANGLVEVLATDLTSGRAARATVHRTGGLTDAEIEREAAWVRGLRIQ
ncbi:MAG TPA: Hsp70 family protein [Gemmataceae bacterium]|jgi:molecular chaperone DnaK|nr:Hsp70 family protein [Gemmataceae bacterium]